MTNQLDYRIKAYRRLAHLIRSCIANLILCKAYVDAPPGPGNRHVLVVSWTP